jgi:large repetitive protein
MRRTTDHETYFFPRKLGRRRMMLFLMIACLNEPLGVQDPCDDEQFQLYLDLDEDGFGDPDTLQGCYSEADPRMAFNASDCDDGDASVTLGPTWYLDGDNDGFGDPVTSVQACTAPEDHVADNTDCDDGNEAYNPGVAEDDCTDPEDYNCDGSVVFEDNDGDGVAACEDCNDNDGDIHPGADEYCDDVDTDCDGTLDEDDALDAIDWYADGDSDGYGLDSDSLHQCYQPEGYVDVNGDCDDALNNFHPGAQEGDCADPNDYNCDGSVGYEDKDNDGFAACMECNDSDATVFPGGDEVCNDIDDDCDGLIDDSDDSVDAVGTGTEFYADTDGDTFGDAANTTWACDQPSGHVTDNTDCDDGAGATYPGADEFCDGVDTDCDGTLDEDDALDADTWYADADNDGDGDSATSTNACSQPSGYVSTSTDCDDADGDTYTGAAYEESSTGCMTDGDGDGYGSDNPATGVTVGTDCDDGDSTYHPGAEEYCDTEDRDCDGTNGEDDEDVIGDYVWYEDGDGDGYGSTTELESCDSTEPSGYADNSDDCDDTDATIGECLVYVRCVYIDSSNQSVAISFNSSVTDIDDLMVGSGFSGATPKYLAVEFVTYGPAQKDWYSVTDTYQYSGPPDDFRIAFEDNTTSAYVKAGVVEVTSDCTLGTGTSTEAYVNQ